MPPPPDPEVSWQRRKRAYEGWLSHPKAFGLVVVLHHEIVAYAIVSVHGSDVLDDTWVGGEEIAELQTLAVAGEARSRGIGSELLRRVEREVMDRGIGEMIVASVTTNDHAVSFYRQRGYTSYLTYMYSQLSGVPADPDSW